MAFDRTMMSGKTLNIYREIDLFDTSKTLKTINKLQKDINRAVYQGINDAVEKIITKLFDIMDEYGVSGLQSDVTSTIYKGGFEISVNGDVALFVEYGTGVVGASFPHPVDPWEYDINNHGLEGWYYYDANKKLRWTAGMPSRPYFYDLIQWIQKRGVILRSINKRLEKL